MILALAMNGMIDDDEWWSLTVVQLWIVFAFIVEWCGVWCGVVCSVVWCGVMWCVELSLFAE